MKRSPIISLAFATACACTFFVLTIPRALTSEAIPNHIANLTNGEMMFWAGGCASCHASSGAKDDALLRLGGGIELDTPFGVFRPPNISPHPEFGIGRWTTLNFVNAMVKGLSPKLDHYYPAFPYPHYQNMHFDDLIDLKAYLDTLPSVANQVPDHELKFPYSIRRGVGLWKRWYLERSLSQDEAEPTALLERGRYLVQGPAHCGACHTPRDAFGGEKTDRLLAGAESFENQDSKTGDKAGRVPNITPHPDGIGNWSAADIAYSLESGFDPDFDSFGGSMVDVQENISRLPAEDRNAIAAYLKSIPARSSEK